MKRLSSVLSAIIFAFVCIVSAHAGVLSDAPPSPLQTQLELQITGSAKAQGQISIGLKITNHSDHTITIQRGIEVDKVFKFKWVAQRTIEAVAECLPNDGMLSPQSPVRIAAGATLDVVPWNGDFCGQCTDGCDKNYPLGAGEYQFVVISAEGERLSSPSFTLP